MVDPLMNLKKFGIPTLALDAAKDHFKEVYHRYKKVLDEEGGPKRQRKEKKAKSKNSTKSSLSFFNYASQLSDDDDHDDESELRLYFSQRNAKVSEKIEEYYWRNEALFPTIFRMAKHYLSMMAISLPSESLFSRVKIIVTDKRNRLQTYTIKMLAVLRARCIIRDETIVHLDSARESDEATSHPNEYHAKPLDINSEKHSSASGELQSVNIVNSQDVDDGKKRKRSDTQVEQLSSSTSGTKCADTSYLQNATVLSDMEDLGVSRMQNSEDMREAEFLNTTHDYPESGDSNVSGAETLVSRHKLESSDAELSDAKMSHAETLNSSHSLELIDLGCIDSMLKEAPRLDIDSGFSDSSENEDSS